MNEESKQVQANVDSKKKISFISALLIVIGGSIGAGIFFKAKSVAESSHSSMILAALCWVISAVAVIAMALALIEISSVRNDNLSLIGWNKVFNSRFIAKASKNFMVYVYLPLTYLFMPLYVIMSLQDALASLAGKNTFGVILGGKNIDWIIWSAICLAMTIYFLTVPTLWSKVGDIQNKVVLGIKFIPIVAVIVLGLAIAFAGKSNASELTWKTTGSKSFQEAIFNDKGIASVTGLGAGLGMFLAIAAIFFAYDGFYVASGIQSEMKEPKKTPLALFIGLGITTIIYLLIAISLTLNGGDVFGMSANLEKLFGNKKAADIVLGIMNLMIAIGVLGIINGFSMWAPRYVEDLLAEGELPFWRKAKGKLNPNFPIFGVIYSLIITIPVVIVFTIIGALGYLDIKDYEGSYAGMGKLYSFADLMANWTAVFTFGFIALAILGGIINRKKNFVEIKDKKRYFLPMAWIAVITVFLSMAITILVPVVDIFLLFGLIGNSKVIKNEIIVSRVMLIVALFLFAGLTFLPTVFEDLYAKKKFGSVQKYEDYIKQELAK
ncbi:APC family permease [Mycoplasmopsis hyopharyngis]|uniref:APC family permease n=1 Tax=Mycoplasmopsis hyopharyngis TaxID=29558 RepID=UPI003873A2ED